MLLRSHTKEYYFALKALLICRRFGINSKIFKLLNSGNSM